MKKVIFGASMLLAGALGAGMLLAGSMANDWTINGVLSFSWNLLSYGLMPALTVFIVVAILGAALGIWGLFEKK